MIFAAALPGLALAQSVNPSGMTLPNFQASALLTANTTTLLPTKVALQMPGAQPATTAAPAAKIQAVADTSPTPQQKP
jgi:hypothetical protein